MNIKKKGNGKSYVVKISCISINEKLSAYSKGNFQVKFFFSRLFFFSSLVIYQPYIMC